MQVLIIKIQSGTPDVLAGLNTTSGAECAACVYRHMYMPADYCPLTNSHHRVDQAVLRCGR